MAEFSDDEAASPLMLALSGENTWDLNIYLDILSNYWVKNEDIDAEFGGFLNVIRENNQYRFVGDLQILRGKGYLFDKTFSIDPDSSHVTFEDTESPDPRLDIYARTRVPGVRTDEGTPTDLDVGVHVSGTLETPNFQFYLIGGESDSALSNEAIVPLLAANYYGEQPTNGAFEERLSSLISTRVARIGVRQLGVETFEIDPTYEGNLDLARTKVTLGFYAPTLGLGSMSNLYLYGSSDISFRSRQEIGFEYRLGKSLLLEGKRDEEELYHLNLKLHREFAY
jgi:hypothetical protein